MTIKYTEHALERIKERGILKNEIEQVLKAGSPYSAPGGANGRRHKFVKGYLVVVYNVGIRNKIIVHTVITAYWS